MCIAIVTCATSQSAFATSIRNTCNVPLKHPKHVERMFATCVFRPSSSMQRKLERGTVWSGQPAIEDGSGTWQWPAPLASGLGPASKAFSLGCLAMGHGMERRGTEAPRGMGAPQGMATAARRSGAWHGMKAPRGMATAARRSRAGGRNREAATAEASGEFLS
jgi:hypothetical protein